MCTTPIPDAFVGGVRRRIAVGGARSDTLPGPTSDDQTEEPPRMKHSKKEREQRARETEDVKRIEAAWMASLSPDVARGFARDVATARARGPLPRRPDMAPGTLPNPPRPGREPKAPKETGRPTRRRDE